jgi:hypothetical protein
MHLILAAFAARTGDLDVSHKGEGRVVPNHKLKQTAHAIGGFSDFDGFTRVRPLLSVTFGPAHNLARPDVGARQ